ncbi:hypothetical protein FA15DRAFT_672025 [Coprinopsis marcescibilis]|uniref:Hemerythrin-like domain-containing protein n=1 Tax=Coprinopsis marcescibilis TaxID=230819 RepID=A0A5C3KNC0_COPMA|nr:hypothetical protein FA15DRAFT_672025 [Coprinopsis marcescibilis]
MSHFHEHFKRQFNTLYELADGSYNERGLSFSMYIQTAKDLVQHLTFHHTYEERNFFPSLAEKMPQFSQADKGDHLQSHQAIHEGLDKLESLADNWSKNPTEYSPAEMKACLDGFREVLFRHLNQEVSDLRGENLQKYFSVEEIEALLLLFH